MHELSLCQSIVELVERCADAEGMSHVTAVTIQVGVAANVETDALQFCFEALTTDTRLAGASLVIETVPLTACCNRCGQPFKPPTLASPCPACGAHAPRLLSGQELRVKAFSGG